MHSLSTSGSSVSGGAPDGETNEFLSISDEQSSASGETGAIAPLKSDSQGGSSQRMNITGFGARATSGLSQSDSTRSIVNVHPWEQNQALSLESRNSVERSNYSSSVSFDGDSVRAGSDGVGSLTSRRNKQKFRRRGRCEVISIAGAAGLGKSCLVQSVQVEARRRGYFASSKFDQARKTPFGPVLKLLSSLFKQVFSESNTETAFHQTLKQYVRPAWPMLHKVLGLPEFLLGHPGRSRKPMPLANGLNSSLRNDARRQETSPASSRTGSTYSLSLGAQSSQEFLRVGSSTKSLRLMNTFLDVLRVFALHKFLCFCLDDLQFADEESLELITQLISSRMKMVIILTYRPDEMLPEKIKSIIEPPNTEGIRENLLVILS